MFVGHPDVFLGERSIQALTRDGALASMLACRSGRHGTRLSSALSFSLPWLCNVPDARTMP